MIELLVIWLKVFFRKDKNTLQELIRAFLLIFVAEMGDKSQIIAMTFSTKYKIKDVIFGVTIGVLINHGLAIVLGNILSRVVPMDYIQIIAGLIFIIFGLSSLKDDGEEEEISESNNARGAVAIIALAFLISELGDKTQLTSMTLATEAQYPLIILLGTTLGMIATSSFGIFIGSRIGDRIPDLFIKIVSSIVFLVFGSIKLYDTLPTWLLTVDNILFFILVITLAELLLIYRLLKERRERESLSPIQQVAQNLYIQTQALKKTLDSICLGEGKCGTCSGSHCLIGYTRFILKEAREKGEYYNSIYIDMDKLVKKGYERKKVAEALALILDDYITQGWDNNEKYVVNKIKQALEIYLFGWSVDRVYNINDYIKKAKTYDKEYASYLKKKIFR